MKGKKIKCFLCNGKGKRLVYCGEEQEPLELNCLECKGTGFIKISREQK